MKNKNNSKLKEYFRLQLIFLAKNKIPVMYVPFESDDPSENYYINTGLLDDIIAYGGLAESWIDFLEDYKSNIDMAYDAKTVYEAKIDFIG